MKLVLKKGREKLKKTEVRESWNIQKQIDKEEDKGSRRGNMQKSREMKKEEGNNGKRKGNIHTKKTDVKKEENKVKRKRNMQRRTSKREKKENGYEKEIVKRESRQVGGVKLHSTSRREYIIIFPLPFTISCCASPLRQ